MTKALRKSKNEEMARRMKDARIERTTGRCCICFVIYNADFLGRGFAGHRCHSLRDEGTRGARQSR